MSTTIEFLLICFAVFMVAIVLAWAFTGLLIPKLRAKAMLDIPNARSSHVVATPRGGGLAVLATWAICAGFAIFFIDIPMRLLWIIPAILVLGFISFKDDKAHVAWGLRISLQALAVIMGMQALPENTQIFQGFLPQRLEMFGIFMFWLWFINLTNFIDGIDGITATNGFMLGLGTALLAMLTVERSWLTPFALIFVGSLLGFLRYNWHPAKVFLGDVGSVPIGFISAFFLLTLAKSGMPAAAILLPLIPFLDATHTLIKRFFEGKKITQAHKEHAYQKAQQAGQTPPKICIKIAFFSLILLILAVFSALVPSLLVQSGAVAFGGVIVSILLVHFRKL